jgi:uncharacterized protein YecT (DUF1311 family)
MRMIPKSGDRFLDKIMRRQNVVAAALACIAFLAAPALAQEKPAAKDVAAIEKCMKTRTGRHWAWERCIGIISEPCAKDEGSMRPSEIIACDDRERAVWDGILNESYRRLREALDDEQKGKLQEMQRAWMASRDKNCNFLYDYFQGTMANPMVAACLNRATGMQALYLRGFADDVAERK